MILKISKLKTALLERGMELVVLDDTGTFKKYQYYSTFFFKDTLEQGYAPPLHAKIVNVTVNGVNPFPPLETVYDLYKFISEVWDSLDQMMM